MKRYTILLLIIVFSLIGCSDTHKSVEKPSVQINMPKDSTVNGYRTSSATENKDDTKIKADDVELQQNSKESFIAEMPQKIQYCANANSKVFHKPDCSFVTRMKDENKVFSSNRDELIKDGFTPCASCKP